MTKSTLKGHDPLLVLLRLCKRYFLHGNGGGGGGGGGGDCGGGDACQKDFLSTLIKIFIIA